jgi:hypothetical protein
MRSILPWSVGALLLGASVSACYVRSEQPPARSRAAALSTPQPQSTRSVIVQQGEQKGVTAAQPGTPAAVPYGAPHTDRERVAQAVALASRQIDRLTRMGESANPERRSELDATLDDLQKRREKVLQDMRELELRGPASPAGMADTLRSELDRDLIDLQKALHDSYEVAPPPGQGMPPPAPLPPDEMP